MAHANVSGARRPNFAPKVVRLTGAEGEGVRDMAWTWRYEDAHGQVVEGPHEAFSSQSDAESWIGQTWRDLLATGAVAVSLVEEDRVEYRMSLLPPGE